MNLLHPPPLHHLHQGVQLFHPPRLHDFHHRVQLITLYRSLFLIGCRIFTLRVKGKVIDVRTVNSAWVPPLFNTNETIFHKLPDVRLNGARRYLAFIRDRRHSWPTLPRITGVIS